MGRPKLIEDDDLLAAARKVFVEKGLAASTRAIAQRAGISEAVIYQRYPTKEDLFFAAMVPPAMDVEALLARNDEDCIDERDHLQQIATGLLAYFRELAPILLPLTMHPSFDFEDFARRHPDSPLNQLRSRLQAFFQTQRKAGRIATDNPGAAALILFGTLHSLAVFERLGAHGGKFNKAHVRGVVDTLWDGLAPS